MAATRTTTLRVLEGGKCPASMKQRTLRALDVRVAEIAAELAKLTDAALFELDEEDIHAELGSAVGALHLARLEIARKVKR